MMIRLKIRDYANVHGLVGISDRVLVAVSGGPDSVALVHLLHELREEFQLQVEVAHLQHGIRGAEAKEDARFVAALAENLGLPFHLKEVDLPRMRSQAGKGNLEALAREERYRFFAEVVSERDLHKVATAHTQDDQAETVLLWLLRGTGMKGLGGMSPLHRRRIVAGDTPNTLIVVRPLLEVSKSEILSYLEQRKIAYRIDRSNQDTLLLRNWIRLELLPKIQQRAGGDFSARLSHLASLFRDENSLLDELARKSYESMDKESGLSRAGLLSEPKALQRRILRRWIRRRSHLRGLEFLHIEQLLRLIEEGPPQGRLSIPGGWELRREYETVKLAKASGSLPRICYSYPFSIGAILRIPEAGMEIHGRRISNAPYRLMPADPSEALFDLEALPGHLVVRNFRRGDRIRPLGMTGRKKLKDVFIDQKVPLSVRATLPLLAMGEEILWIPGYGRSDTARVTEKTTSILHIKAVSMRA